MNYKEVHSKFRLNGISFSRYELLEVGYCLIKEGASFEENIGSFLLDWLNEKDTLNVNSSGSTGEPKSIEVKKQHMVNSALATGRFFSLQPGDSALLCLPTAFISGKMMLVRAMVLGLNLDYVVPGANPLFLNEKRYDFAAMVPLQVQNALSQLRFVKTLIVGGAPISQSLQTELRNAETTVFETYGMTETLTHIALKKIAPMPNSSFFKALPNIKLSIDKNHCLWIHAPDITDTTIKTNDVVHLLSDTEFEWLGRFDNVINSGGIKLHPERIEQKLEGVLKNNFFVAGVPDPVFGQKLILVAEGAENKELLHYLKETTLLDKYEIPREVYNVPEFSRTKNGKVQRKETLMQLIFN